MKNKLMAGIVILVCLVSSALSQDSTRNITSLAVFPVAKPGENEGALSLVERCFAFDTGRDDRGQWWKFNNTCPPQAATPRVGVNIIRIQTALTFSDGSMSFNRIGIYKEPGEMHAALAPKGEAGKLLTGLFMIIERIETPDGVWELDTPDGKADQASVAAVLREAAKVTDGNYDNLGRDALPPMVWKPSTVTTERKQLL
jgi:hypothetical protein